MCYRLEGSACIASCSGAPEALSVVDVSGSGPDSDELEPVNVESNDTVAGGGTTELLSAVEIACRADGSRVQKSKWTPAHPKAKSTAPATVALGNQPRAGGSFAVSAVGRTFCDTRGFGRSAGFGANSVFSCGGPTFMSAKMSRIISRSMVFCFIAQQNAIAQKHILLIFRGIPSLRSASKLRAPALKRDGPL